MVNVTVNGLSVSVPEGSTILEATRVAGFPVPTLCFLKGINEIGACRVCVVELEGADHLITACNNQCMDGMVIRTNSQKVREARRTNIELLLSQHRINCPACNRDKTCQLKKVANSINMDDTKAYSTQLAIVDILALYMAQALGTISDEEYSRLLLALQKLPEQIEEILQPEQIDIIRDYAELFCHAEDAYFIGRHVDNATCLEGSLKLKEIAYIHAEAYAAGELKHGPISLIEEGTIVVAVATNGQLFDKTMSNVKETKARGAMVLGITVPDYAQRMAETVDCQFLVPKTDSILQPSLSVVPLQLKAIYKDNADTIIGNMDSQIFLGGTEPTTLKELSTALGKETIDLYNTGESRGRETSHSLNYQKLGHELLSIDELAVLDGSKCILQLRGVRPFLSEKYDLTQHSNYQYTADCDPRNTFNIEAFLSHKLTLKPEDVYEVVEVDESA